MLLCLDPDAAIDAVPAQIVRRAIEDVRLKAVRRLEFEVEEAGIAGPKPVLRLGRYEDQVARAHRAHTFGRFDGPFAFHNEVEVLADLVIVIWRRRVGRVMHDAGEHVVDVCQLLVDEEGAHTAGHHGFKPW